MKGKFSLGIWLIFFGLITLLHNFDIISFNFWALIPYWPLAIIALGANLILQNKANGSLYLSLINICLCLFLSFVGMTSKKQFNLADTIILNSSQDTTGTLSKLSIPYNNKVEKAKLSLNAGGIALTIDSISSKELIEAYSTDNIGLKLEQSVDSIYPNIKLNSVLKEKQEKGNKITIVLNEKPIWDLDINVGATALEANLKNYKIANLQLTSGAASMKIILGLPAEEISHVEINTAASSCKIDIPNNVGCRVEMSTLLSSSKLKGFTKKGDYWETDNYETADKKYNISLDGAANSLKINRY